MKMKKRVRLPSGILYSFNFITGVYSVLSLYNLSFDKPSLSFRKLIVDACSPCNNWKTLCIHTIVVFETNRFTLV